MIQITAIRVHYINGIVVKKERIPVKKSFYNSIELEAYRKCLASKYNSKKTIDGKKFNHVEILFNSEC